MTESTGMRWLPGLALGAAALVAVGTAAFAQPAAIALGADRQHPESITSTRDGTIFISYAGKSAIYRLGPGATTPVSFITEGLDTVLGILAVGEDLWVCSSDGLDGGAAELDRFNIATGALTSSYAFPGGGLCNDLAFGRDGTVFVSDGAGARILALRPEATELTVFAEDAALLADVSGLAVLDGELIAASATGNTLTLIDITEQYGFGGLFPLTLSRPIENPDGMRALRNDEGLLLVEGNRLVLVTVNGSNATVAVLQEGFNGATGVAEVAERAAYVVEGRLDYLRDPSLGDPGAFTAIPVPIPAML